MFLPFFLPTCIGFSLFCFIVNNVPIIQLFSNNFPKEGSSYAGHCNPEHMITFSVSWIIIGPNRFYIPFLLFLFFVCVCGNCFLFLYTFHSSYSFSTVRPIITIIIICIHNTCSSRHFGVECFRLSAFFFFISLLFKVNVYLKLLVYWKQFISGSLFINNV